MPDSRARSLPHEKEAGIRLLGHVTLRERRSPAATDPVTATAEATPTTSLLTSVQYLFAITTSVLLDVNPKQEIPTQPSDLLGTPGGRNGDRPVDREVAC